MLEYAFHSIYLSAFQSGWVARVLICPLPLPPSHSTGRLMVGGLNGFRSASGTPPPLA